MKFDDIARGDFLEYANGQLDRLDDLCRITNYGIPELEVYLLNCTRKLSPCFLYYEDGKMELANRELYRADGGWDIVAIVKPENLQC